MAAFLASGSARPDLSPTTFILCRAGNCLADRALPRRWQRRPAILALAHMDVVTGTGGLEARSFQLTEEDGYFFGRGTLDIKWASSASPRRSCA